MLGAIGGLIGTGLNWLSGQKNIKAQKEFAQHGISWKVEDAKRAGIHPLAALGAQTHSFAPVSIGDPATSLAQAGQDISSSINRTRDQRARVSAVTKTATDLQLTNAKLQNELLAAQIAKINASINPPLPTPDTRYLIDGQGNTPIKVKPAETSTTMPGQPGVEAATIPGLGWHRTPTGWAPNMSKELAERMEEDHIGSILWGIRNYLFPAVGINRNYPEGVPLPPGHEWYFHPTGEYRHARRSGYFYNQ